MTDPSSQSAMRGAHVVHDSKQWQELRELITGPERSRLDELAQRLDDPAAFAEQVSKALPDAIHLANRQDSRMAVVLQPTIDTALRTSARRNPYALADALFPAFGPAIRKAVSAMFLRWIQSLDHVLSEGLSLRALRWRFEAWRTGTRYAEVVLRHTLVYRVEQIYLIHGRSGVLLAHAAADGSVTSDPDLVSGMLTAIQDFVRDSFERARSESLQSLRMDGEHGIWIEHGPEAVLAVAIRGIAPESLRERFRSLLEHVHVRFSDQWRPFAGDVTVFALVQPELEQELVCELREPERRQSKPLWVACGLAFALGLAWLALEVRERWRRDALEEALRTEPGLVLLAAESRDGTFWIDGLRDPGARDPHALIVASGLEPDSVRERWTLFYALDGDSVLRRARTLLEPPDSVTLSYRAGILTLAGRAPQRWIRAALDSAPGIAGVERVDAAGLQDPERTALAGLEAALEQTELYFEAGTAVLSEEQSGALADAAQRVREIQSLAARAGLRVSIRVVGHADPTGSQEFNRELRLARALAVQRALVERGASAVDVSVIGQLPDVGSPKPETSLHTLRNVQFRVAIDDSGTVLDD